MSNQNMVLYTAIYDNKATALADLEAIEQLHEDEMVGKFDAAVIDEEDGKPHIVKRVDRPRVRIIPEALGRGALRRKELHEAAAELIEGDAGLIVLGEPTIEKGFEKAVDDSARLAKRYVDAGTDELATELKQAAGELKSGPSTDSTRS
jgi:hypothetical protein